MRFRSLFKNRGLGMNLLASFCFIMLAVYGWGMEWSEVAQYLLVLIVLFGGLIGFALMMGWLLRRYMSWRDQDKNNTP